MGMGQELIPKTIAVIHIPGDRPKMWNNSRTRIPRAPASEDRFEHVQQGEYTKTSFGLLDKYKGVRFVIANKKTCQHFNNNIQEWTAS